MAIDSGVFDGGASAIDAGARDAGLKDAGVMLTCDYAGTCNVLTFSGPEVIGRASTDPLPSATTGGPIVDGIYDLTSITLYGQPDAGPLPAGFPDQTTLRFAGPVLERVTRWFGAADGGCAGERYNQSVSIDGGTITLLALCPTAATVCDRCYSRGYFVTPTSFSFIMTAPPLVETFTKR